MSKETAETFARSANVQTKPGNFDMTYQPQAMVSLLRSPGMVFYNGGDDKCALLRTVADQIEALEAENERLREIVKEQDQDLYRYRVKYMIGTSAAFKDTEQ